MGIDTSMFPLYLNLVFFGMLGLGMLLGFLRGLRKSLYSLIVKLIFYVIFFATLGVVSRFLWHADFAFIGDALGMAMSELSNTTSLSEALPIALETMLADQLDADLTNPEFVAFTEGVGMFAVKILYAILYFTVIQLIYRFITWMLYLIFLKPKKEDVEVHGKKRLAGMGVGFLSGALAVYVTLILLGGIMNIAENVATLAEGLDNEETVTASNEDFDASEDPVLRLADRHETMPMQTQNGELDTALTDLNALVSAYNNNLVVSNLTRIELTNDSNQKTPLNLHLFDMIFSFEYKDDDIAFRNELAVFTDAASLFLSSEYQESNDLSDVEGSDVEALFVSLSNSKLLTNLTPLAIEMGAEHYDVDLDLDREEIYAIDYQSELAQMGSVFGVAFDMLNTAGVFAEDADYDTIDFAGEGEEARTIFEGLGDSELATLGAYVAMEPLLERMATDSGAILTVPDGIVWEDEFDAFGEVSKEVLDTGITLGDIQSGDIMTYLQRLSAMDLTVILNSRIIEQALVNVFSGDAEIEGMDMMVVNDDVKWTDETDEDGEITEKGELRIVLEALNAFAENEDVDAIESFDQNVLLDISEDTLDAFLDSEVLTDTIGDFIVNLETDAIVTPPSALRTITVDEADRDVVTSDEIKKMFLAVQTIEIDDFETVDFSADLLSTLEDEDASGTLDQDKADTLFDSTILHATVSKALFDLTEDGTDALTVPESDYDEVAIRSTDADDSSIEYLSTDELSAILEAVIALDLSDFENFETLDAETIAGEIGTLLDSAIIHATFSEQILSLDSDGTIEVPYYDETDSEVIRKTVSNTEFINADELEAMVDGLDLLTAGESLTDFSGDLSLSTIYDEEDGVDERSTILASSTLQATISEQILGLENDGFIEVPHMGINPDDDSEYRVRRLSTGGEEDTEYIYSEEIKDIIEALYLLGIDDVTQYDGEISLDTLYDPDASPSVDRRSDLLDSAIMHATITNQMLDLGSDVLAVPENGLDDSNDSKDVRITAEDEENSANDREYVTRAEIEALIASMDVLGFNSVTDFDGAIDLSTVFGDTANQDTLLDSSTIHATIVEQLETLGDDVLMIPDATNDGTAVRTDVEFTGDLGTYDYITKDEIKALIDGMNEIGVNDFDTLDFVPGDVFNADYDTLLASASIHLTLSDIILENAKEDQSGDQVDNLIVPNSSPDVFRQLVPVEGTDTEQIERDELKALLEAMNIIGISEFDDNIDPSIITDLGDPEDDTELNTILNSGSMHVTIDRIIDENGTISIPNYDDDQSDQNEFDAVNDTLYGIDDITKKAEIIDFVNAVDVIDSGENIQSISFDFDTVQNMEPDDQAILAESMIARRTLTRNNTSDLDDIESVYENTVGETVPDSYYHVDDNDDPVYLNPDGFTDALDDIKASSP